jgi:glycosyltransferase involved in cell wall biosynthesis
MDLFLDLPPVPLGDVPVACYVGSFERTKGVDVLLEAWPKVRQELPHARLLLVGDGTLEPVVSAVAAEDPTIELIGRIERSRLPHVFDRAWVVVVPSRSEGLGRVVLEAMARGRPTIASDVGGLPELVDPGVGVLVPADDPAGLAGAIADLLSSRTGCAKRGEEARRRAERHDPAGEFRRGMQRLALAVAADSRR